MAKEWKYTKKILNWGIEGHSLDDVVCIPILGGTKMSVGDLKKEVEKGTPTGRKIYEAIKRGYNNRYEKSSR